MTTVADDKANTSLLLDAALRAGHIEPTEAGDEYRVTPAGVAWAMAIITGPRTWSLPPEPGPEVKAVRDRRGHRWTRHPDYPGDWEAKHITDENGCYPTDRLDAWGELLAWFGPVTDATGEA